MTLWLAGIVVDTTSGPNTITITIVFTQKAGQLFPVLSLKKEKFELHHVRRWSV